MGRARMRHGRRCAGAGAAADPPGAAPRRLRPRVRSPTTPAILAARLAWAGYRLAPREVTHAHARHSLCARPEPTRSALCRREVAGHPPGRRCDRRRRPAGRVRRPGRYRPRADRVRGPRCLRAAAAGARRRPGPARSSAALAETVRIMRRPCLRRCGGMQAARGASTRLRGRRRPSSAASGVPRHVPVAASRPLRTWPLPRPAGRRQRPALPSGGRPAASSRSAAACSAAAASSLPR